VKETIRRGIKEHVTENDELRTIHTLGTIMVVTTSDDKIVITVGNRH
jgi:3-dehydroquinate synthase class II